MAHFVLKSTVVSGVCLGIGLFTSHDGTRRRHVGAAITRGAAQR